MVMLHHSALYLAVLCPHLSLSDQGIAEYSRLLTFHLTLVIVGQMMTVAWRMSYSQAVQYMPDAHVLVV